MTGVVTVCLLFLLVEFVVEDDARTGMVTRFVSVVPRVSKFLIVRAIFREKGLECVWEFEQKMF